MNVDQELYRTLLEALPDPVAIYDMEGLATHVNPAFVDTFGWSKDELIGKRIDFVPDENQTETQWAIQEVFKNGRVPFLDTRRYTKSGTILDVQLSASLFTNDTGEPKGIIVILRDITSHKQTEAARRESEERYHAILSNTDEGYYEVDTQGVFTFCNDALAGVFGWPKDELIGKNYEEIMDEATAVAVYKTFNQVYKTGAPGSGENWPILAKDGSIHHVNSSISLIKNAQGKPIGCRGIVKDMTARLQAEQALTRFKMGIERSNDAIFLTDNDGTITYINPAFTEIYGFTEKEAIGKTPRILKSGVISPEVYNHFWQTLLGKEVVAGQIINKTKDGRLLTIEGSNNPILDETGELTGFLSIHRDITARQQAEQALQTAYDQLESRIEARTTELIEANVSLTEEIVDRTVAEEELKQGYENQAILNQLLQLSIGEGSLDELLEEAFEIIISTPWFATLPKGSIFLVEDEPDVLVLKAKNQLDPKLHTICNRVEFGHCLCGLAAASKEIQFADCVGHLHANTYEGMDEHGHYNVPILIDEKVVGVLNLYVEHGHKSNEQELSFLEAVANTLASLIQRERSREALEASQKEIEARAESLAVINRVADTVYQALDHESVLQQAIDAIATYTAAPSLALFLLDDAGQVLNLLATKGIDEESMQIGSQLPLEGSLSGLTIKLKDIIISNDMEHDDRLEPSVKKKLLAQGLKNAVSLPILFHEEVLGVVNLIFEEAPTFTQQERETLLSIGKTIGLAISNAQYVAQIQTEIEERQQAEGALRKSRENLAQQNRALLTLARSEALATGDLAMAMHEITEVAARLVNVERASVWNYYIDDGVAHIYCADLYQRNSDDHTDGLILSQNDYPAYFKAIANERFVVAHDAHTDPNTHEFSAGYLTPLGINSMLDASIQVGGQVHGVLCLEHIGEAREWSLEEQNFAGSLADLLALAISAQERIETQEALQASEIQTRAILNTALDAVIAIDKEAIITTWNPQAESIFGWSSEEVLGQSLTELIVPPRHREGHQHGMARYLKTGVKHILDQRIEIEALHRDGYEFPIELSVSEIKIGDESTFSAFARDITRRKESEAALHQREEEARQFQEMLQILQEVNIELSRVESLDELYKQIILKAKERLGFDRIGLILYDPDTQEAVGAYGTDVEGNVTSEKSQRYDPGDENRQILLEKKRAVLREDVPLWYDSEIIGKGWNAITGVYTNEQDLGWLAADNLLTQEPPKPYQLEILSLYGSTVGNLINRKGIEQQIRESLTRRGQQVEVATRVAQEIATALDIHDLYERVVTLVKEEFDFYHVQLLRYDSARNAIALATGYGEVGEQMLSQHHTLQVGVGLIGTAVTTGQPMLRADVTTDPNWKPNDLLPDTKSELAIPIKLRDKILGVLDVQSDQIGGLNTEDQLILEGLCGQIASAIESTNLRQEMAVQLEELSTLQRQMTREGWATYRTARQQSLGYLFDQQELQPLTQETAVTNGKAKGSNGQQQGLSPAITSEVIAPLQVRGETFGLLGIEESAEQALTDDERDFLDAISLQVAEALEAARLFEQTQESLAEQERLASELETVAEVSAAASTILETDKLLQSVVDLAKNSFNLYHAQIYLYDDNNGLLILQSGSDTVGRLMTLEGQEINPNNSKSPIARAATERQGIIINNLPEDPDFVPHPLLPNTRSELVVPFIVGDKVTGVMDLQSDKVDYFTAEDMQIHSTLGAQIAIAVQNATLYAEQVAATEKLREVDRLKSEFLASMSHELRTPLNSIIGFADVILEGLDGPLTDRMEEDITLIKGSGIHLRELIGDILDMSKIEAGRMELRYENLDIAAMVTQVVATNQPLAEEKQLYLKAVIEPDLPTIEADRTRLRQVFYNIISNAIKFTEKGGVTVDLKLKDDFVHVAIQDTGIGIKQEDIAIVFEQFRQIDGSLNRKVSGTGLGMPITKNLVELHGGEIWIESTMGMGTTFLITIPRYKSPPRGDAAKNIPTL